ncbi:MAG: flavin reductase family protein [bacterium]
MNSLSGYKPVSLIGTRNNNINNLGVFSNIVHIGADPAYIGFVNRPKEAAPHTLANIENTRHYTINHIHPNFLAKAHQTSAKYPQDISEFEAVGLTPVFKEDFHAPFVGESLVQYALELQEIIPIKLNNSFFVIGKLLHAFVDDACLGNNGLIDLSKAQSVVSLGIDGYYIPSPLKRYAYAKPDKPISEIDF